MSRPPLPCEFEEVASSQRAPTTSPRQDVATRRRELWTQTDLPHCTLRHVNIHVQTFFGVCRCMGTPPALIHQRKLIHLMITSSDAERIFRITRLVQLGRSHSGAADTTYDMPRKDIG